VAAVSVIFVRIELPKFNFRKLIRMKFNVFISADC